MTARVLLALLLTGWLAAAPAAGPAIGVAVANGDFRVDQSRVAGNTTLFEGSKVETAGASSRLRLGKDTRLELSTDSRLTVFRDHARLEAGSGEMATSSGYQMEARGLRIAPAAGSSVARVRVDSGAAVLVAAGNGTVRVFGGSGVLLANVAPGATLRFESQAQGQEGAFRVGGCLLRKGGKFILVDQTTNVVVELRGQETKLGPDVGNRIQVSGAAVAGAQPAAGTSQVVQVETFEEIGPGGCVAAAAAVGADPITRTPPAAAPAAKASHTTAIIAGVAVAAGGGVAAAVLASGGKSKSP